MRFWPRYAPEPKADSSSAAPQKAQNSQNPQQAGGANKTGGGGAAATDPDEAKAKQKAEQKKARHDSAVDNLKKLRGDPDAASESERDGTAVSSLVSAKGYSKGEARKIVSLINKSVSMDFDGDPVKAEAALKKYQDYLQGVPARKNGKGEKLPHAEWAAKYANWVGDMKGVSPSEAAQIPISDVMGVTGKGKRQKVSKNKAKHVQLIPIGLKTVKGGKVYDAFKVAKSSDVDMVPNKATVVRDGKKWFVLEKNGTLRPIRIGRGRRKKDPKFDRRGILIIDPRYSKVHLVAIDTYDAGDINKKIENWIIDNPEVKTKQDFSDKRAGDVKKALENSLHSRFGPDSVTVSTHGRNVMIKVNGEDKQRGLMAKKIAAYMRGSGESHFASIFNDLGKDAYVLVNDKANRVAAGQNGSTVRGVARELENLHVKKAVTIDSAKTGSLENKTAVQLMGVLANKLPTVKVKGTVATFKVVKGQEPTPAVWKEFEDKVAKKYKGDVTVKLVVIDPAKVKKEYTPKVVAELETELMTALWDGNPKTKARAKRQAKLAVKRARDGRKYGRNKALPMDVKTFKKSIAKKRLVHADDMRKKSISLKDKPGHDKQMEQYRAWWKTASTHFKGTLADHFKPDKVEEEHPRTPGVYKSKRGGRRGRPRPSRPRRTRRTRR